MKTLTIANKDFDILKPEQFIYCNKKYISERYISKDRTILITSDNGFNYTRILIADNSGKAIDKTAELLNRNIYSYPIYSIESDELSIINTLQGKTIKVHQSHFKN